MSAGLVPFDFHGDRLEVARDGDVVRVGVRSVCDALDIDTRAQLRKLRGKAWACVVIMTTQVGGQGRELATVPLDALPMWLATIEPSKVAKAVRAKLASFQTECARVLADHFLGRRGAPSVDAVRLDTLHALTGGGDLRDNKLLAAETFGLLCAFARAARCSWQRAHGTLRRAFRVVSYLAIRITLFETVRHWLLTSIASPKAPPRLLPLAGPQLPLFPEAG